MDSILKFAKELLALLELYPAWAKILFLTTALACGASVMTFILLYQGAEKRLSDQKVGSELSATVGVLTQPAPTGVETPLELHGRDEGGIKLSIVQPTSVDSRYDRDIKYVLEKMDVGLRIRPSVPYLSILAAGGPIADLSFNYSPFPLVLPVVDLKVVNNSSKTIFFTDAVFEVEQSRIDGTPILLIPADSYASNAQHILLINEGWGKIDNCLLHFNLVAVNAPTSYNGPFQNEVSAGAFAERTNVDISSAFERAGVNNAAIKALKYKEISGDSITVVGAEGRERTLSREQYRRATPRIWAIL